MLCGVGVVDGLVIKVKASWTSKWWPKSCIIKLCLISSVVVLCAACLGDKPVGLLPALVYAVVQ
jgi:hypothetical protein